MMPRRRVGTVGCLLLVLYAILQHHPKPCNASFVVAPRNSIGIRDGRQRQGPMLFVGVSDGTLSIPRRQRRRRQFAAPLTQLSLQEPETNGAADSIASTAAAAATTDKKESDLWSSRAIGLSVLLTVPLTWGTYTPVVRYLYAVQPAVPGFVFSAAYYTLAAVTLQGLLLLQENNNNNNNNDSIDKNSISTDRDNNFLLPIQGGIELGTYLFLGNGLQILGLKTVPSDRAGFLVQLTTVFVPLLSATLAGDLRSIPLPTWFACILAFAGVIVMGRDGKELSMPSGDGGIALIIASVQDSFTSGDLLIVAAAVVYTIHVVRLGRYAAQMTPLKLAAYKASAEAVLSTALVMVCLWSTRTDSFVGGQLALVRETGQEIASFASAMFEGIPSGAVPTSALASAIGATLWTGWVTCAYTIYAQSFGQSRVSPTEANLVYTIQPIFTALFAWVLLGETLGPAGYVGGGLIGSAVYLAATAGETKVAPNVDEISADLQVLTKEEETVAVK